MARYVMEERRACEIAELAQSVADYYFPEAWIDPESVIRDLGITLSFNYYGNCFDGMLECRQSRFHIYCNLNRVGNSTNGRARFTLGHEMGHYFIDDHRNALRSGKAPSHPSFCSDSQPELAVEIEANHFASHLLMPRDRVAKLLSPRRQVVSLADVLLLESSFRVSFQSAAIRVIETAQDHMCAGVMWRPDGGVWYVISPVFRLAGYTSIFRDRNKLASDCATQKCLRGELSLSSTSENVTTASQWFYNVWPGSDRDVILDEVATRLGAHGVFTLLTSHRMKTRFS